MAHDLTQLQEMSRIQVICLLLWLAWPSVCLAIATSCLYLCKGVMRCTRAVTHASSGRSYLSRMLPHFKCCCQTPGILKFTGVCDQRSSCGQRYYICRQTVSSQSSCWTCLILPCRSGRPSPGLDAKRTSGQTLAGSWTSGQPRTGTAATVSGPLTPTIEQPC